MSAYTPSPLPSSLPTALRSWLSRELIRIANAMTTTENVSLRIRGQEPERIQDGMIIYANGTDFDPGSGAGVYARESGAWVKL